MLATVRGWLTRARRHIAALPEGETHAIVAMVAGYERFFAGDLGPARESAAEAVRLGTAHELVHAQVFGTVLAARIQIAEGQHQAGLARLRAAAAGVELGIVEVLAHGSLTGLP